MGAREKKYISCSRADVPVLLWFLDTPVGVGLLERSLDSSASAAGGEGSRSLSRLSCAL